MKVTLENLRIATDRWMNPILLKELRATFRGWKFLAVHCGFLALLCIALVVVILSLSDVARIQPWRIGQGIHQVFMSGMALAILLILPAFASTAVVTEREQNTFELLQTTSLEPHVVVRGKFLASMTYSAVFLFSSLPVGVLAFLYGGVTVVNLLLAVGHHEHLLHIHLRPRPHQPHGPDGYGRIRPRPGLYPRGVLPRPPRG
jgi:ABC-type transport system involved in multi-copper enzyme maturation permease subunit